jgi:hypothetical protein
MRILRPLAFSRFFVPDLFFVDTLLAFFDLVLRAAVFLLEAFVFVALFREVVFLAARVAMSNTPV